MLFSQDLSGSHQGGLKPRFHGKQDRRNGDHSLAGADIALQQPIHWMLSGKIMSDFRNDFGLRASEFEWQPAHEFLKQLATATVRFTWTNAGLGATRSN